MILEIIIVAVIIYAIKYYIDWKSLNVPGEIPFPFIGNILSIKANTDRLLDWFIDLSKKHGHHWVLKLPFVDTYMMVTDTTSLHHILKANFDNYVKGENMHEIFYEFLGDGIFNADGEKWKVQRQTASHLFSTKELKNMVEVFHIHGSAVIDHLSMHTSNAEKKVVVDIQDLFQRFTLDSIGHIAFGVNIDSLHQDTPFSNAFDGMNESTTQRMYNPFYKYAPWIPSEKVMPKNAAIINKFCYDIITERRRDNNADGQTDLLSRYLQMDEEFSDLYLRNVMINLLLAGRDTTSQLLIWALYMLSKNPEKEAKLIDEINATLNGELPNYDNTKSMPYLKAVLDETLRLWPPVPLDRKTAVQDDTLPCGLKVKKGTILVWNLYAMGRMEEYYEKATEFIPERWLSDDKPKTEALFIPFMYGPRQCLGQKMAYVEAQVMMCLLLQKFRFRHVPENVAIYDPMFVTLKARYGMEMYVYPVN